MDELIEEVKRLVDSDSERGEDEALSLREDHEPVPISEKNFHALPDEKKGNVSYIDGGNAEIIGASSFSLQLVRVASVTYGKEKKREKQDYRLLVTLDDGEFSVKTFPENVLPELTFDSLDPDLRTGNQRISAARVASVARRLLELKKAMEVTEESDLVVIDGDLYPRTGEEENILEKLSGKQVCGFSKTSGVMTKRGKVMPALLSNTKEGSWYYEPVYKGGEVKTAFARMNKSSNHVFRLDYYDDVENILSFLKPLCSDAVFPGYPYGLIEADRTARITNREVQYSRTKLMSQMGDSWKNVKAYLSTGDAHEVLDNIG